MAHGHDCGHANSHGGHGHEHGHSHGGVACQGHGQQSDAEAPLIGTKGAGDAVLQEQTKLKRAAYFVLVIMLVEIVGGVLANSLAIVTDAAHMLSDLGGFIVSLACLQLSTAEVTQEYTYGFKQAEVLGALFSIMIVWGLTVALLVEAFERFYHLQEINGPYMLGISTLGFAVNLILMKVLGHNHSHGGAPCNGHSHGDGENASLAMRAAIAHVIGDIVQSLGVCVAALCIWLQPFDVGVTEDGVSKWNYADPMCTVLFGILVLFTTKATLTQTVESLMVKAPKHINQTSLIHRLSNLPNVQSVHDLHVWAMGSKDVLCTAHVMVNGEGNSTAALQSAIGIAQSMGIGHSTFQIEIVGEFDPAAETYGLHENPLKANVDAGRQHQGENDHVPSHGACNGHSHGGGHGHAH